MRYVRKFLQRKTLSSFDYQWENLPSGQALLSDSHFRENVTRILLEEELCMESRWFRGKEVLDVGCGNGRWTYGFLQLGCRVTALDATARACEAVRQQFSQESFVDVVQANILDLPKQIGRRRFDLVFAWGVLHHTGDTERALKNVCRLVKPGGLVYVYLYGKASVTRLTGLKIGLARSLLLPFSPGMKKRILSCLLPEERLHSTYDMLSPSINDRLTEHEVRRWFSEAGFDQVQRTIHHTELFLKAWRSGSSVADHFREPKTPPYWFQRLGRSGTVHMAEG